MFNVKSAFASTTKRPDVIFDRGKINFDYFTKSPKEDFTSVFTEWKSLFSKLEWVLDKIIVVFKWIGYGIENMQQVSIDLLSFIYKTLATFVLTTPTYIFSNPYLKSTSLTFSIISISLVTFLTVYESIMQVTKQKHTKFKDIIKRYFIVVGATGFAPFLFEKGFELLNKLSTLITKMGGDMIKSKEFFANHALSGLDVSILFAFDVVLLAMLFPILLQNGRRWWDLLCLATLSPLAGVAWVFDRHRHYFNSWWNSVKRLSLIQIVYAIFILLLGVFIFSTRMIDTYSSAFFVKMLVSIGALHSMINPPRIVLALTQGDGRDVFDTYDSYKKSYKDIYNTLTLKNFRPANLIRDKVTQSNKRKEEVAKLRQKHGIRSVDHLLKNK